MSSALPTSDEADHFPYTYSEERHLPRFLRVRAEGIPLRQTLWSGLSYLRKYWVAKRSAPPEEITYFDNQRQLLRALAAAPCDDSPRLALVGDIMWMRDSWDTFLSPEVLAYLNGHAAVVGNLESPISQRSPVPAFWPDYFTYNSHPGLLTSFTRPDGRNTFSALATANNHSLDRGPEGLADTLAFLDTLQIPHAGVRSGPEDPAFVVFDAGGIRFGFYAACWGLNNPALLAQAGHHIEILPNLVPTVRQPLDLSRIATALTAMRAAGAEFRIVSLHWGHEFEFYPTPEIMRVGRDIVRLGADLLMGHHPHVLQPLEVCFVNGYDAQRHAELGSLAALQPGSGCVLNDGGPPRKALIAYSLGNFATAMFRPHCRVGLILSLGLQRDRETGGVDWCRPDLQLVYNVHRDPQRGHRRLMLLETYLRERERAGDGARRLRQLAGWLRRHVAGG